jgi:hypothetical protein
MADGDRRATVITNIIAHQRPNQLSNVFESFTEITLVADGIFVRRPAVDESERRPGVTALRMLAM